MGCRRGRLDHRLMQLLPDRNAGIAGEIRHPRKSGNAVTQGPPRSHCQLARRRFDETSRLAESHRQRLQVYMQILHLSQWNLRPASRQRGAQAI